MTTLAVSPNSVKVFSSLDRNLLRECAVAPIQGWFYRYYRNEVGGNIDRLVSMGLLARDCNDQISYCFVLTEAGRKAVQRD